MTRLDPHPSDQHAGVEDGGGVEFALGGAQGAGEGVGALAVVAGAVVAADGVMVRDRAAELVDGVHRGGLDLIPLFHL